MKQRNRNRLSLEVNRHFNSIVRFLLHVARNYNDTTKPEET